MIKKTTVIILLVFNVPMAFATTCCPSRAYFYYPNGIDSIAGTIKGFSRNTIDFYDEDKKIDRQFIYIVNKGKFKANNDWVIFYTYVSFFPTILAGLMSLPGIILKFMPKFGVIITLILQIHPMSLLMSLRIRRQPLV